MSVSKDINNQSEATVISRACLPECQYTVERLRKERDEWKHREQVKSAKLDELRGAAREYRDTAEPLIGFPTETLAKARRNLMYNVNIESQILESHICPKCESKIIYDPRHNNAYMCVNIPCPFEATHIFDLKCVAPETCESCGKEI